MLKLGAPGTELTNLLDNDIAAITHPSTISDRDCVILTVNTDNDGRLVKIVGSATETVLIATDSGRDYAEGVSDLAYYYGAYFWTSHTDIAKDDDYDWWSTVASAGNNLTTGVPHPLCIFEDFLAIGDGRYVHYWDGAGSGTAHWQALKLPEGFVITALESWNGYLWIHAERVSNNLSGYLTGDSTMFYWDFINPSTYNGFVPLNQRISAMKVYRGTLYVWTPQAFGIFTGTDISPIFSMRGQILKHHIAVSGDKLFFKYPLYGLTPPDSTMTYFDRIACYGQIEPGESPVVTFPIMVDYFSTSSGIKAIAEYPDTAKPGVRCFWRGQTTKKYVKNITFPQTSFAIPTNAGYESAELWENIRYFGGLVRIRKIGVLLDVTRPSRSEFSVFAYNSAGTRKTLIAINDTDHGSGSFFEKQIDDFTNTYSLRLLTEFNVTSAGAAAGIIQIIIDYEPIEGSFHR
jgi:hypothetical protein